MTSPLIEVVDLTMGWGDVVLQQNANFEVERGDIFVILGGSGCGKSTLVDTLSGADRGAVDTDIENLRGGGQNRACAFTCAVPGQYQKQYCFLE